MRGLLILASPVILGGVLVLAMILGRPEPLVMKERPAPKQKTAQVQQPRREQQAVVTPLPARALPAKPAPADEISRAVDDARLASTYRNYRTAVATGNKAVEDALHRVLEKDRDAALKVAQADLDRARTDADRDITKKTMEALRR